MNNLKAVRKSKNVTQQELAEQISSHKSYISELENGNIRDPSLGKARLISLALQTQLDQIFPHSRGFNHGNHKR